jgi:hypothetical protein
MLPNADRAVAGLLEAANALLLERGAFALRAFADAAVLQQPAAEHYSLSDARLEALLLSQIYADPHPLGKPAELAARIVNAGKEALANPESERILRLADCSALLGPATGLNLPVADHAYSKVMDLPRRLQDEIVSVRLELVRRLGWPVFARQMINARQQVLARKAGRRPFGPLPFDPMESIDAYLRRVRESHPMSLLWPLDHLWGEG